MHILILPSEHFVTEINPLAGIFQYEQALALKRAGHQVGVISVGFITTRYLLKKYPYQKVESTEGVNIYRKYKRVLLPYRVLDFSSLACKYSNLFLNQLEQYIVDCGMPDVIHAHNFLYAGYLAKVAKEKYRIPFVLTEHSSAYARGLVESKYDPYLKDICNEASELNCVSSKFRGILSARLEHDFSVLSNLVDTRFFNNDVSLKCKGDFTFINVGSLDSNKNQALLLLAFAKVFLGKKVKLKIIGDGPLTQKLKSLSINLGIDSQVIFMGRLERHQVSKEMSKAHCFVLPSNYETFGVVLIEALASGLPLIATKSGGPEDIINDQNGVLVDVGSEVQLSLAMKYVFENYDRYDAEKLRNNALERFSEREYVKVVDSLYANAMQ